MPRLVCSNYDLRVGCLVELENSPGRKYMVMRLYSPVMSLHNHSALLRPIDDGTGEGWYDPIHLVRVSR